MKNKAIIFAILWILSTGFAGAAGMVLSYNTGCTTPQEEFHLEENVYAFAWCSADKGRLYACPYNWKTLNDCNAINYPVEFPNSEYGRLPVCQNLGPAGSIGAAGSYWNIVLDCGDDGGWNVQDEIGAICEDCSGGKAGFHIYQNEPKTLEDKAIAALENAARGVDAKTNDRLNKAMEYIKNSMDPVLWIDNLYLDPKHGGKVFDEGKKAVKELMHVIGDKDTPQGVRNDCQAVIEKLIAADKSLAETAIKQAINSEGKQNEIDKAREEMLKAQEEYDRGHYDNVIDHYKKAWEHAQKAMN